MDTRKIGDAERQRIAAALAPHRRHDVRRGALARRFERQRELILLKFFRDLRQARQKEGEEGAMVPRPADRIGKIHEISSHFPTAARPATVQAAQHLQLDHATYVNPVVKEWNKTMKPMASNPTRRFVRVAPPSVHAGVGEALRQAFRMDGELRSLAQFEELLARLD